MSGLKGARAVTWSIGIYEGDSPFRLRAAGGAKNPVLTGAGVSDVDAEFVADPFMLRVGATWHMFFEVLNRGNGRGEIGLATSADGLAWTYRRIVLAEPFHLSYPYVFEWEGEYHMIPETLGAGAVTLYRAEEFPVRWARAGTLIEGGLADPSPFRFGGRWWMFACPTPYGHDALRLYTAERLRGPWAEHPSSPLVTGDRGRARPAGRVLVSGGRVVRFAQDCNPVYGTRVRAFEVSGLSESAYAERELPESPVLQPDAGGGWNGRRMHHLDAHPLPGGRWLACVDGHA